MSARDPWGPWWLYDLCRRPVVVPGDVDPGGHLKEDGIWMLEPRRLPFVDVEHGIYRVPAYFGDEERLAYLARRRRVYRRPRWLLEHGVSLAVTWPPLIAVPAVTLDPFVSEWVDVMRGRGA